MSHTDTLNNLTAALALAPKKDQTLPAEIDRLEAVRAALWAVPTSDTDLPALIIDADVDDIDNALRRVGEEHARRAGAAAAIRGGAGRHIEHKLGQALRDFRPTVIERVRPAWDKAAAALAEAAPNLPAGPAWEDPAAVLSGGTESAHRATHDALTALLTIAAVHAHNPSARRGTSIAAIAALPAMHGPVELAMPHRTPVRPEQAERARTITAVLDAYADDPRTTLVDIARGRYDGVKLSLAKPDEYEQRTVTIDHALRTKAVDPRQRERSNDSAAAAAIIRAGTGLEVG